MNIKALILEALVSGAAKRDENNNVSFELFGTTHSVRATDEEVENYEASIEAKLDQARANIAEAEGIIDLSKAIINKYDKVKSAKR